jgi:hypothetical protein
MNKEEFKQRTKMFAINTIEDKLRTLYKEDDEILSMTIQSINTARRSLKANCKSKIIHLQ